MEEERILYGIRKASYRRCTGCTCQELKNLIEQEIVTLNSDGKILVTDEFVRANRDFLKDLDLKRNLLSSDKTVIEDGHLSILRRVNKAVLIEHEDYIRENKNTPDPIVLSESPVVLRERQAVRIKTTGRYHGTW